MTNQRPVATTCACLNRLGGSVARLCRVMDQEPLANAVIASSSPSQAFIRSARTWEDRSPIGVCFRNIPNYELALCF